MKKIFNRIKGAAKRVSDSKYKHIAGFLVLVLCVGFFGGFNGVMSNGYDSYDMNYLSMSDSVNSLSDMAATSNKNSFSVSGIFESKSESESPMIGGGYRDSYNDYDMVETEDVMLSTDSITTEKKAEKLVYSASLQIETKDIDVALESIYAKIKEYNGIIQDEKQNNMGNVTYEDYYRYSPNASAYIFVRIPQEHYETFINGLEDEEGQIVVSDIAKSVENMTDVYYDQESRLRSLRTQEERLFDFMETATTVTEMLEVEDRLTDVQYEIDTTTNVLNEIDNDVKYSKVTLNIEEVLKYTEREENPKNFIERVISYIKGSAEGFTESLENWLEFAIYFIPYLIVLVVVYIVFIKIKRKVQNKRKQKKEDKKNQEDLIDSDKE